MKKSVLKDYKLVGSVLTLGRGSWLTRLLARWQSPPPTLLHPSSLVLCLSSCLARPLFSPSLSPLSHTTRGWLGAESVCWMVISTAAILNVVCGGGDKISQRHAPVWISGSMFCSLLSARKMWSLQAPLTTIGCVESLDIDPIIGMMAGVRFAQASLAHCVPRTNVVCGAQFVNAFWTYPGFFCFVFLRGKDLLLASTQTDIPVVRVCSSTLTRHYVKTVWELADAANHNHFCCTLKSRVLVCIFRRIVQIL